MINFVPAYFVKILLTGYEIVDDKDEIYFASISFDGDSGLIDLWNTIIKFPTEDFVISARISVCFMTVATSKLMVSTMT